MYWSLVMTSLVRLAVGWLRNSYQYLAQTVSNSWWRNIYLLSLAHKTISLIGYSYSNESATVRLNQWFTNHLEISQ